MKRKDSFTVMAIICAVLCLLAGLYLGWSRNLPAAPPPAFTPPASPEIEHFGSSTGVFLQNRNSAPGSVFLSTTSTAPPVPTGSGGTGTNPNFGTGLTGSGPVVMPGLNTGLNSPNHAPAPPPPPPPPPSVSSQPSAPASPPAPPAPQPPPAPTSAGPRPH